MAQIQNNKKVEFVSLISRDDKPLYIQSFDTDIDKSNSEINAKNANKFLKYNFLSHMALDIFASPSSLSLREQQQNVEENGGVLLLFIQDDIPVYGYETNNGLKIVLGLGIDEDDEEDDDDEEEEEEENVDAKVESEEEKGEGKGEGEGEGTEPKNQKENDESNHDIHPIKSRSSQTLKASLPSTTKKVTIKELFSQIHKCYLRTICNPFTNLQSGPESNETILQSPTFDRNITKLIKQWNDNENV